VACESEQRQVFRIIAATVYLCGARFNAETLGLAGGYAYRAVHARYAAGYAGKYVLQELLGASIDLGRL